MTLFWVEVLHPLHLKCDAESTYHSTGLMYPLPPVKKAAALVDSMLETILEICKSKRKYEKNMSNLICFVLHHYDH